MIEYNLILVLDKDEQHILMCLRQTEPYHGLYNLVGGKVEPGEEHLQSAYRELEEETGISRNTIELFEFIDYVWHPVQMMMKVFIGRLQQDVVLVDEAHPLEWISIEEDFFDSNRFAGEGNIGHMVAIYKQTRGIYFEE